MRDGAPEGLDLASAMVLTALREAAAAAGDPALSGPRVGLYLGTSTGGLERWVPYHAARVAGRTPPWSPDHAGYSGPAERVAAHLDVRGPLVTVATACTSSTAALGLALDDLREGAVDLAIAGGVDVVDRFVHAGFDLLGALSGGAMNPFAAGRRGLVLGDGAAVVLLEREESARARGVAPRALLAGAGLSADANHMTGPDREGAGVERALRAALADAGYAAADVDLVCAHATATPYNDAMEARALHRLLGRRRPGVPVVGFKPVIGHTLGACGALEVVACVEAMARGTVPATAAPGPQDPDCPMPLRRGAALELRPRVVLSGNSAFAGSNAALVIAAPEGPP